MNRQKESVDETIDRVAARMTMVPADRGLAGRIAEQIGTPADKPFGWQRVMFGAAAVVAMAIVAVILSNDRRDVPPSAAVRVAESGSSMPEPRTVAQPVVEATEMPRAAQARRRQPIAAAPLPEIPRIDALASPVLLTVDNLPINTLTITSVDLAPLDLANLVLTGVDDRDHPKE